MEAIQKLAGEEYAKYQMRQHAEQAGLGGLAPDSKLAQLKNAINGTPQESDSMLGRVAEHFGVVQKQTPQGNIFERVIDVFDGPNGQKRQVTETTSDPNTASSWMNRIADVVGHNGSQPLAAPPSSAGVSAAQPHAEGGLRGRVEAELRERAQDALQQFTNRK